MLDTTRITQIIMGLIALALTGYAGMDSQHANSIAVPAAATLIAILIWVRNELTHSKRYGALMSQIGVLTELLPAESPLQPDDSAAPVSKPPVAAPDTNGSLTKTATSLLLLLSMILVALALPGCGVTEKEKIGQAVISIDGSANAGITLLQDGVLSDATALQLSNALQTAMAAVDAWDAARLAGVQSNTDKAEAAALAAIANLDTVLTNAKEEAATRPAPTTQPATLPNA